MLIIQILFNDQMLFSQLLKIILFVVMILTIFMKLN